MVPSGPGGDGDEVADQPPDGPDAGEDRATRDAAEDGHGPREGSGDGPGDGSGDSQDDGQEARQEGREEGHEEDREGGNRPAKGSTGDDTAIGGAGGPPRRSPGGPDSGPGSGPDSGPSSGPGEKSVLHRFRHDKTGPFAVVREVLVSTLAVAFIGLVLFGVSGVWPPMVAVESGSMQPHMYRGDLVFIMEEERLAPASAVEGTGIVPHEVAEETGYWRFGDYGDVVVYRAYGKDAGSPIIHRAMFWVEAGENWYPRTDKEFVRADSCAQLQNCPAPHAGFITKGDNNGSNPYYDQSQGLSSPVKPSWIKGTARVRIPWLGHVRLFWAEIASGANVAWILAFAGVRRHHARVRLAS